MRLSRGVGLLAALLVVSIAINLFLTGNQLGQRFRHPAPMNFEQRLEALLQSLPEADRSVARGVLDQHRQDLLAKLHLYRSSAAAAGASIRSEQFNDADARAAFAKANGYAAEFRQAVQEVVIEIAGKVSPAGREHLRPGVGGP